MNWGVGNCILDLMPGTWANISTNLPIYKKWSRRGDSQKPHFYLLKRRIFIFFFIGLMMSNPSIMSAEVVTQKLAMAHKQEKGSMDKLLL